MNARQIAKSECSLYMRAGCVLRPNGDCIAPSCGYFMKNVRPGYEPTADDQAARMPPDAPRCPRTDAKEPGGISGHRKGRR